MFSKEPEIPIEDIELNNLSSWFDEKTKPKIEELNKELKQVNEQISQKGTLIPLRELVSYNIVRGPREIRRENQQREVIVTANLKGQKISQVVPAVNEKIADWTFLWDTE